MTEGNRKQKRFRARQASVGDQRLFLKIPAGRFLRNHSRFYGAVSAARAGLVRADGAASAPGGRLRKGVLRKEPGRAWERTPPRLLSRDGPAFALGRRQDARHTDRFRQKVEADSGHWEKRLCHLQTHTIDLYYAHGKEWARLHPTPDRPGKTIPCRR